MIDLAALPEWADVACMVLSVWAVVAVALALVIGAVVRRDEQVSQDQYDDLPEL